MARGELITLGTVVAALGGAYKLSEFLHKAKRLRDVGPANAVYVRIIGRVRSDLDEVRRLLAVREVHDILEANPDKSKWVYGVMRDVRGALQNITPHTERVADDVEEGRRIGIRHRVYWLISEQEKLENREKELVVAHSSLNEVVGYLTALEPVEKPKHQQDSHHDSYRDSHKETHVDIDITHERDAPQHTTERVEREVWVEQDAAPRRVEERREVHIERHGDHHEHRRPHEHYEERRDVYVDERERGPTRYEERDIHIEREVGHGRTEERDIHIERTHERDPRDAQYEEEYDEGYEEYARYERRPPPPQDDRRRPIPPPLGRRPESFEDRLPERDTWMQSNSANRSRNARYGPYGEYAEYGAPQPVGAAHYQRRFQGDAGFGDEEILNPQPVPLERQTWVEQKEDLRYDEYGNKLPDRYFPSVVPRPYRSRM